LGLGEKMKKYKKIRKIPNDNNGIGLFAAAMITALVIGGISIAALGVYQVTQKPDVTYNITDTGFSLAGLEIDSIWLIVIGAIIFFGFIYLTRRKN